MGQKYQFYVDINHKENGIYRDWTLCAELKAKGGTNFKGFFTQEEAKAFIDGAVSKGSGSSEKTIEETQKNIDSFIMTEDNDQEVTLEEIIKNLDNCEKHCECSQEQKQILNAIADSIMVNNNYDVSSLYAELEELCEIHKDVDAVIFADGSADKVSGQSKKLGIGILLIDVKEKSIQSYGYRHNDDTDEDMDWLFKGSNDSAEMIVAVSSMRLSREKGYRKIRIYQDNVRPLSYFYGLFRKVNTAIGVWFLEESKNNLKNIDVRFIYVPSHGKTDGYDNIGKNDSLKKLTLASAKKFNDAVDDLANVKSKLIL